MHISNINNFRNVKNDILSNGCDRSGSECNIVGDMKCFADTSLKRSEFFINLNCIIKSDKYINKKDTYDILS